MNFFGFETYDMTPNNSSDWCSYIDHHAHLIITTPFTALSTMELVISLHQLYYYIQKCDQTALKPAQVIMQFDYIISEFIVHIYIYTHLQVLNLLAM